MMSTEKSGKRQEEKERHQKQQFRKLMASRPP